MRYEPDPYYELGRVVYASSRRAPALAVAQDAARLVGRHLNYVWRTYGYYRLFCRALGFGKEIYQLGPRQLDTLRAQIDWDSTSGEVGVGLGGKWGKREARRRIRALLEETTRAVDD